MDNITQGVIGGSLYTLITGKKTTKHFLLGALITNIPDLDIFVSRFIYDNPIDQFFFHRGIFHSLIFLFGLSFVLGAILYYSDQKVAYRMYVLGVLVSVLFGHLLIDGMTTYGMRYFLPWNITTFSTDNIFVVDFGMWFIVGAGMLTYFFGKQKAKIAKWILGISAAYFALSFIIQCSVQKTFEEHYPTEITQVVESKTIVEPLQIFLWRHVAKTDDGFYKGYYSIFDSDKNIDWQFIPRNKDLETTIQGRSEDSANADTARQISQILSFSRDLYTITGDIRSGLIVQNLLMGNLNGWLETGSSNNSMFGFEIKNENNTTRITQQSNSSMRELNKKTRNTFRSRVWGNK